MGAVGGGQTQPGENLVDACVLVDLVIEVQIVGGLIAGDLGLGTGPEETGSAHALAFGEAPQRRAAVPASIGHRGRVADAIAGLPGRVVEPIGDEAVMLGIKAGDDGEVIREGQRREAGNHAFRGPHALSADGEQMRGVVAPGVVPSETVERDEHDIVRLLRGIGVRTVVDMDDRQRKILRR